MAEKATNDGPMGEKLVNFTDLTPDQYQKGMNHIHEDVPCQFSFEHDAADPTWICLIDPTPAQVQSFEAALR